jgi:Ca2+-transporting ATPase
MSPTVQWHALETDAACRELDSSREGLDDGQAKDRLLRFGANELPRAGERRWLRLLAAQFRNILILILLVAAAISLFLGETIEAVAILVIIFISILLGFAQEYRAERAIESLRRIAAPNARVRRGGRESLIPARELVPGDVILLATGDRIPADGRLLEAVNLRSDESVLTGESMPVDKDADVLVEEDSPLAERRNMVYFGTTVAYGRGTALVTSTGTASEFGKVTGLLAHIETVPTPLQRNLRHMARGLAVAALLVVLLIVAGGLFRGVPLLEMFVFGVALAVAVVPEALPAVVTISLALGVQRMARRHALIKHLPAVETLGSISVICADKTGTLTKDEMTVRRILTADQSVQVTGTGYVPEGEFRADEQVAEPGPVVLELLRAAVLASDASLIESDGIWEIRGDPTEGALVVAAVKAGLDADNLRREAPRVWEIPFESETKRMTTGHRLDGRSVAYVKGAPEVVLAACDRCLTGSGEQILDAELRKRIRLAVSRMAEDALRVIAVARKEAAEPGQAGEGLVLLGMAGMLDPPRETARRAVELCRSADIRPIMITGDHPDTARAVARELGILGPGGTVLTGAELDDLDQQAFRERVRKIDVYARVSPEHKLRVIEAWQSLGKVVAMTGDGINDAPALKRADVGVAMGRTGTDVSREAAAMTLTDDRFISIVGAVEEGRSVFDNVRKYLMYLLSSNIGEIGLIGGATLLGLPLPLTAVQILYVNLATDGFPAIALAVDPEEKDVMRRPPRDPGAGIFSRPVILLMILGGAWSMLATLMLFYWGLQSSIGQGTATSLTFAALVLIQFVKAYVFRSDRQSILVRPFANRWLNIAIVWELMLLMLIFYLPPLQVAFGTHPLTFREWAIVTGIALTIIPVLEGGKVILRK